MNFLNARLLQRATLVLKILICFSCDFCKIETSNLSGEFPFKADWGLKGCYALTAIDKNLNESPLSNIVCIENCPYYELPNVFTPNNDCLNDFFRPLFTGFESLTFSVYDYNGNLIYTEEAQDGSIDRSQCPDVIDPSGNGKAILGWDGKKSDGSIIDSFSPIFTYSIRGVPLNRANDDQIIIRSGIFTLLK